MRETGIHEPMIGVDCWNHHLKVYWWLFYYYIGRKEGNKIIPLFGE